MGILHRIRTFLRQTWLNIMLVFVIALSGNIAATYLSLIVDDSDVHRNVARLLFSSLVFIVASMWLYSRASMLFVRTVVPLKGHVPKRKVLFLFISTQRILTQDTRITGFPICLSFPSDGSARELRGDIDADVHCLEGTFWSGQQMLRAIRVHVPKLERIVLVGSEEVASVMPVFSDLLMAYAQKNHFEYTVESCAQVDFEDFDAVTVLLNEKIRKLATKDGGGYRGSDIMIDITGGQKPNSVAGAAVTLEKSAVLFQYVKTGGSHDVVAYDIGIRLPPK